MYFKLIYLIIALIFDDGALSILYSNKIMEILLNINKYICLYEEQFKDARELRVDYFFYFYRGMQGF